MHLHHPGWGSIPYPAFLSLFRIILCHLTIGKRKTTRCQYHSKYVQSLFHGSCFYKNGSSYTFEMGGSNYDFVDIYYKIPFSPPLKGVDVQGLQSLPIRFSL